ncbi:MAG: FeoA family protein [Ignavibacteriaceae bacterium]
MNLAELKIGQKSRITKIGSVGPLKRRLMDMGILVGEEIKMEKVAPMGDPLEISIKNYKLSLRKNEAQNIDVEIVL